MSFGGGLSDSLKGLSVSDDDSEVEDCLVIGIDFGTTYSGVAWSTRVELESSQINFITSWPDNAREEGKVPTELWYDDTGEPIWGYSIPADADPFRWFKLLLLHREDLNPELCESSFLIKAQIMLKESGKTAVDLVADYLRLLWEHIMSTIEKARGESVVEALVFHVIVTVPAIWKGYARQAMEEAVKKSGILNFRLAGTTKLVFAPEPEVAAFSTLLEQGSSIRPGNVYVICDAGGGTVDLISYEVRNTKPIILQEVVIGTGGLCGGIFIDQAFEHMCSGRLGSKWKRLSKEGIRDIMRTAWEYGIKPQFKSPQSAKQYIVALPAEAFRDQGTAGLDDTKRKPHIKNGRIYFDGSDIKKVFEGVFADISKLVEGQIQKAAEKGLSVTGIILVGGLGASPYLYDYLKNIHSKAGIVVLQSGGVKPRTAICRGAVLKGFLEAQNSQQDGGFGTSTIGVESRVSRASYGITYYILIGPDHHDEEDKDIEWNSLEGRHVLSNQMQWYLRRCDDEAPPTRKIDNVRKLGEICCNLDVQFSDLPYHSKDEFGTVTKRLNFDIELVPSGASVEFVLYVNGRKQGSEYAKIDFA
ncbi:uncharacterized protein JN550_003366 [Neoarthrinium moseri]|uniref:uncharacterized protein n=1 Tax=Neoarthrinium moseri TaxID=1658444 RepID=UPI001FDE81A0|nr:uncharacterized protein JN550_003366 [Neoarthrinium moseri]KAI1873113.1 hypothetical protein JN550_003366 [Neoarthrinium moseri]